MTSDNEDDKPTVVLDLNALKKRALKDSEDLTGVGQKIPADALNQGDIEFTVPDTEIAPRRLPPHAEALANDEAMSSFEDSLDTPEAYIEAEPSKVILFDFQSDLFTKGFEQFPASFAYTLAKNVPELNVCLRDKTPQVALFHYDANPKAINQLLAQIKIKFPHIKTLVLAKKISPEKARAHAQTASGAHGYYQLPLDTGKLERQLKRFFGMMKAD
jgi:hypothetical protein